MVVFSVSQGNYIVPGDGTDDFPVYPDEGAVRFDKHATAVGSFNQTGIVQLELNMTGVPYTKGSEIDVVIMVDMSGSMNEEKNNWGNVTQPDRVQPAKDAVITALNALVKNEDGSFNDFAEVEALEEPKTDDNKKFCTKQLKVGAKLSFRGFVNA